MLVTARAQVAGDGFDLRVVGGVGLPCKTRGVADQLSVDLLYINHLHGKDLAFRKNTVPFYCTPFSTKFDLFLFRKPLFSIPYFLGKSKQKNNRFNLKKQ